MMREVFSGVILPRYFKFLSQKLMAQSYLISIKFLNIFATLFNAKLKSNREPHDFSIMRDVFSGVI